MTALHGHIEPGTVANVLQFLALGRAQGRLSLVHPGSLQGHVWFDGGRVTCVEAKPLHDLAALSALLAWDEGRFSFRRGAPPPRRTLDHAVELLLVQASRDAGHGADAGGAPLGADAVLAATDGQGTFLVADDQFYAPAGEEVLLSLAALHLWRRLDGASSLRHLATGWGRPVDELVAAAAELLDHGLADFVSLVVADPRFAAELSREAVDLLGPVGAVVIEDAFFELGLQPEALPVSAVDELFAELARAFPTPAATEFMRRAEALRALFSLEPAAVRADPVR